MNPLKLAKLKWGSLASRLKAIEEFSARQEPGLAQALAGLLGDKEPGLRLAAVRALGATGHPGVVSLLLELFSSTWSASWFNCSCSA